VNAKDKRGKTSLMYAAEQGNTGIVDPTKVTRFALQNTAALTTPENMY
jgi:ankyrin repeat protein